MGGKEKPSIIDNDGIITDFDGFNKMMIGEIPTAPSFVKTSDGFHYVGVPHEIANDPKSFDIKTNTATLQPKKDL